MLLLSLLAVVFLSVHHTLFHCLRSFTFSLLFTHIYYVSPSADLHSSRSSYSTCSPLHSYWWGLSLEKVSESQSPSLNPSATPTAPLINSSLSSVLRLGIKSTCCLQLSLFHRTFEVSSAHIIFKNVSSFLFLHCLFSPLLPSDLSLHLFSLTFLYLLGTSSLTVWNTWFAYLVSII